MSSTSLSIACQVSDTVPLKLRFGGSLVEQLGAQLYPSVTAAVAELISNAWDAEATRVWVTMPSGADWSSSGEIVVVDDGLGMTRADAQEAYLVVGRKRRLAETGAGEWSASGPGAGRRVHGRKGIGKLAAFGTAGVLECTTVRDRQRTDFLLDYDEIRRLTPDKDYPVEDARPETIRTSLAGPDGQTIDHGTRVRLTRLRTKRAVPLSQFMTSMSRRFALDSGRMRVEVNGVELSRYDIPVEIRFPRDAVPGDSVTVADDGWAEEEVDGKPVRWWFGFTAQPLGEDQQQGVSVLANGKMAQRPFKFERSQGTEGQLGQEYLVGEVEADWLDEGRDIEDDLIQSNRDQLQLEDTRLTEFLQWGRRRLAWALRRRSELRRDRAISSFQASAQVTEMLEPFTTKERSRLLRVASEISKVPEIDEAGIESTMRSVVNAQSDRLVRELMEQIEETDGPVQAQLWSLVHEFGLIDARKNLSLIEARLATIAKLKTALQSGAREVPDLHRVVVADAWLLDPRWNLLGDEVDVATLGVDFTPEQDEDGLRMDFLFGLQPHAPARLDEVVVVEIKRGTDTRGRTRKAEVAEVNKFHTYVLAVQDHYAKSTDHPAVRGLMIAQDYTAQADQLRKSLETLPGVRLQFQTWDRVIDDTERMHLGWLAVTRDRTDERPSSP